MTTTPIIHFYGGIGTIGGTKITVEEGGYRVLFDFGLNYAPGGDFWGGKVQARTGAAGLRDYVTLGYMPAVDGLYKPGQAESLGLKAGAGERTQVFISHLHLDHMAVVDYLADEIPVWMHRESLALFRAVAETGERPAVPIGARAFEWEKPIQVGPMKVTPVEVDHDVPGASALLIETSAGTVVYTGDLRYHGSYPEKIDRFIQLARAANPKILLIEGTRLGEQDLSFDRVVLNEDQVAPRVMEILSRAGGLGLITLYPRNPVRINNIAKTIGQIGRRVVLSPEMAHVYASAGGDLTGVSIYRRSKDDQALASGNAPAWLVKLLQAGTEVLDSAAIRANPTAYLLQLFYWDLNELVDLQPPAGSVFIHSNGEPLGKFDPAFELFTRWLTRFEIPLVYASSTGHASAADLHRIVEGIRPEILMPIHSRNPEHLNVAGTHRILPNLGDQYEIGTGKQIG